MGAGYARYALENIPGNELNTPTLSTKKLFPRLQELELDPGVEHLERNDELTNTDEPLAMLAEAIDPSWAHTSRLYPDLLGFMLTAALGPPVTTAGNGVITDPDTVAIPAGAHRHVWTAPFGPAGPSPQTMQLDAAYTTEGFFMKGKGAATEELAIESPERGGVSLKAKGPALYLDDQSDPSLTPAIEADTIPCFMRANLTLPSWLSGTGVFEDFAVTIEIPLEPIHSAGSGSKYPDVIYKGDAPIQIVGSVPKTLVDQQDWDALIAATGFAAMARWVSPAIIASSYPYKFYVQGTNCQYTQGAPAPLSNKRRRGMGLNFKFTRAGSASATLTLVNATASYA